MDQVPLVHHKTCVNGKNGPHVRLLEREQEMTYSQAGDTAGVCWLCFFHFFRDFPEDLPQICFCTDVCATGRMWGSWGLDRFDVGLSPIEGTDVSGVESS